MSKGNVDLHRRAIDAYNARDIEAFLAIADPSIELRAADWELGGVYRGHDGLRTWAREIEDAWGEERRIEPEAYFDLGEHTLLFQVAYARGRQSGAEVALRSAHVMRWRDGRCMLSALYSNRQDALKDLGVTENELEPIAP